MGEANGKEVLSLDRTCTSMSEAEIINTGVSYTAFGRTSKAKFLPSCSHYGSPPKNTCDKLFSSVLLL